MIEMFNENVSKRSITLNLFKLSTVSYCVIAASSLSAQTLEQSITLTLSANPEIKSVFHEFASAKKNRDASEGAYLPSVDFDAAIGYEGIKPATKSIPDTDYTKKEATISLTQLLWDGASTQNNIDRSAAEAESIRLQLISDIEDKSLEVAKVYIDVVKAKEILELSENNLEIHLKISKDIKRRVESGIGSTADLHQVNARVAKAHSNLASAQNNLYDTNIRFTKLVGEQPKNLVSPQADSSVVPIDLADALELAFDNHPVIKASLVDVDAAFFQYEQSKSKNYPTFSIEASQSWSDDADGNKGSRQETLAMLRVRYNLYNGGSDSDLSESAAYQLNKAKDLRDSAYRNVEETLNLSWNALDFTLKNKNFIDERVESVSATVTAYQKQYKIGKRTLLDLLNTENELFEAKKNHLDLKYDEQYAKYRILNSVGLLINSLSIEIPEEWNQTVEY